MDKIIRLFTPETMGAPFLHENAYDNINVIRSDYSEELMAFFIRAKTGVLLIVNQNLTPQVQAKAISFMKNEIKKCGTATAGVLKKDFEYYGSSECCDCYHSVI